MAPQTRRQLPPVPSIFFRRFQMGHTDEFALMAQEIPERVVMLRTDPARHRFPASTTQDHHPTQPGGCRMKIRPTWKDLLHEFDAAGLFEGIHREELEAGYHHLG
jgi:hypothetical protein